MGLVGWVGGIKLFYIEYVGAKQIPYKAKG